MTPTREYEELLRYLNEVLVNEFPSVELLPEHLILAILDNSRCHANLIIDNVLMSESVEYIRQHIQEKLRKNKKPILSDKKGEYSKELYDIIYGAVTEASDNGAKTLGTEYIILAILNPKYKFKIAKELYKAGLQYDYVLSRISDFEETQETENEDRYISNNSNNRIPLKSEIQSKISVSNGESPNII